MQNLAFLVVLGRKLDRTAEKCPKIARNRHFLVFFEVFDWHSDILDSMKKKMTADWMNAELFFYLIFFRSDQSRDLTTSANFESV